MRINGICAYRVELPLHEGSYKWSGSNSVDVFDSTVVAVQTDAGIAEIAPHLLGLDPTQLQVMNRRMDQALRGHPATKHENVCAHDFWQIAVPRRSRWLRKVRRPAPMFSPAGMPGGSWWPTNGNKTWLPACTFRRRVSS